MTLSARRTFNHAMKSLPAALTALALVAAALPALAQGDGVPGLQIRPPEPAPSDAARNSDLFLAHRLRLGVPPALTGDDNADAPKLSIELGYGKSPPPLLGATLPSNLPEEFWGRGDQRSVKANLSLGF
jgi:hypothetical protein